jgi:formylglycine-generating enzyme required for sulfatase activity
MTRFTKYSFAAISILFLSGSCSLFEPINAKKKVKVTDSTPPGTLMLTENLYIDRVPVTNFMYQEFLDHLENYWSLTKHEKMKDLPRYGLDKDLVFKPQTGSRRLFREASLQNPQEMLTNKLSMENYYNSPFFQSHPVVNVAKKQAELFCLWRSDIVNAVYAIKSNSAAQRERYPSKVLYRLPTKREMIKAQNKLEREFKLFKYQDQIYAYTGNFDLFSEMQDDTDQMTIMEIKEIGKDKTYNSMLDRNLSYYKQQELKTGFRCICEVVNN